MKKQGSFKTGVLLAGLFVPCFTGTEKENYNYSYIKDRFSILQLFSNLTHHPVLQFPAESDLYNNPFALNLNKFISLVPDLPSAFAAMLRENFHLHEFSFFRFDMILNYFKLKRFQKPQRPHTKRILNRKLYRYKN